MGDHPQGEQLRLQTLQCGAPLARMYSESPCFGRLRSAFGQCSCIAALCRKAFLCVFVFPKCRRYVLVLLTLLVVSFASLRVVERLWSSSQGELGREFSVPLPPLLLLVPSFTFL